MTIASRLDAGVITEALRTVTRQQLQGLEVLDSTDSTNSYLLRQLAQRPGMRSLCCIADTQSAGRGRRGRTWVSPPGANLYLSLSWQFEHAVKNLAALGVYLALMVASGLRDFGVAGLALKWPNDVLWHGRKLGGMLLETRVLGAAPPLCIVGLGLNVQMPMEAAAAIHQPWADLAEALRGECPDRNRLAAHMLDTLLTALDDIEQSIPDVSGQWAYWDAFRGQPVRLETPEGVVQGRALGINPQGQLILEIQDRRRCFPMGDVSLRLTTA